MLSAFCSVLDQCLFLVSDMMEGNVNGVTLGTNVCVEKSLIV